MMGGVCVGGVVGCVGCGVAGIFCGEVDRRGGGGG